MTGFKIFASSQTHIHRKIQEPDVRNMTEKEEGDMEKTGLLQRMAE